jgi:UDPglucose 6-dehydrogenase
MKYFDGNIKDKTIAVWGLSFKPHTDDMREAPSLTIISRLLREGARVKAYDPVAMQEAKHHFGETITYADDQYDTLIDSDALAIVTEWPEFKFPNFKVVKRLLNSPVIFDGRNIYDVAEMKRMDIHYFCIGIDTMKQS